MSDASISKSRERYLLERFLSVENIPATITREGESPDFGILVGNKEIGVEITEVFIPTAPGEASLQARESITSRIVASAKSEYERRGGTPLHVTVTFFSGPDIRQIRRDDTALAIVDLVCQLTKDPNKHTSWSNRYDGPEELNIVAFVNLLPVPEKSMAHWGVGQAGWVAPLSENLIRARVMAKNGILLSYKISYPENWLIVAIDGGKPSQFFDPAQLPIPLVIPHDFDQAYFFRAFPSQVIPIHSTVPPNLSFNPDVASVSPLSHDHS